VHSVLGRLRVQRVGCGDDAVRTGAEKLITETVSVEVSEFDSSKQRITGACKGESKIS
jgi:hypothetical protein